MAVTTRQQLIDYCLRNLGQDVIEINVSEDQLEDRCDEALEYFQEYHFDGTEKLYFKHLITGSSVDVSSPSGDFIAGETVTGNTSGASCVVYSFANNTLVTRAFSGVLVNGETLVGSQSGVTATVAGTPVIGDTQNRYIDLPDSILTVNNVLPFSSTHGSGTGFDMFDVRYQMMLNDMYALTNVSMHYYVQTMTHLAQINHFISPNTSFEFTRSQGRLFIRADWDSKIDIGSYIVIEAYAILDPEDWPKIYDNRMLKRYLTALIKLQWGNNLKKFEGMQLPGGVTMNGQKIFDEASEEKKAIEAEIQEGFQLPVDFYVG